jgi:N-methylhydantoinase A/oxoprolinase/acetone carboxylase beta subunit
VGAQALARRIGLGKLITFDMGGTTAASSSGGGEVDRREYRVGGGIMHGRGFLDGAGYLLRVPAIDLAEVRSAAARSSGSIRAARFKSARRAPERCLGRSAMTWAASSRRSPTPT